MNEVIFQVLKYQKTQIIARTVLKEKYIKLETLLRSLKIKNVYLYIRKLVTNV